MRRLLCWFGWHSWEMVAEVYWCLFYRCAKCGKEAIGRAW